MAERSSVPLVRMPREEQIYDREEVLGRDAASVFPTEVKKAEAEGRKALAATVLGDAANKFISETELNEIHERRGEQGEAAAASKPLAQILAEAKEAKEAAFQQKWKDMKTGKNRPLDEEEAEFLEGVVEAEAARLRAAREEEEAELAAFQAAREAAATDSGPLPAPAGPALPGEEAQLAAPPAKQQQPKQQPAWRPKAAVRLHIKAVAKPREGKVAAQQQQQQQQQQQNQQREGAGEPASKRQRTGEAEHSEGSGDGLAGLLGGYGSDSDSG